MANRNRIYPKQLEESKDRQNTNSPSGGKSIGEILETVLSDSFDRLITELTDKEKQDSNSTINAIGKINKSLDPLSELQVILKHIDASVTAVAMALYGSMSINDKTQLGQFKTLLSKKPTTGIGKAIVNLATGQDISHMLDGMNNAHQSDINEVQQQNIVNDNKKDNSAPSQAYTLTINGNIDAKALENLIKLVDINDPQKSKLKATVDTIQQSIEGLTRIPAFTPEYFENINNVITAITKLQALPSGNVNAINVEPISESIQKLINIPIVEKENIDNINNITSLFSALSTIPTIIGNVNAINVEPISESIQKIILMPEVDNDDISNIKNMSAAFASFADATKNINSVLKSSIQNIKNTLSFLPGIISKLNRLPQIETLNISLLKTAGADLEASLKTLSSQDISSSVTEIDAQFNKLETAINKLPNISNNIKNLNTSIQQLSGINVNLGNVNIDDDTLYNIKELFSAVSKIYKEFDNKEEKFDNNVIKEKLESINELLKKPDGVLYSIVNNIAEASTITETQGKMSVINLTDFLNSLTNIGSFDEDKLDILEDNVESLHDILFGNNDKSVENLIAGIKKLTITDNQLENIKRIKKAIIIIGSLVDEIIDSISIFGYISATLSITYFNQLFNKLKTDILDVIKGITITDATNRKIEQIVNVFNNLSKLSSTLGLAAIFAPFAYAALKVIDKILPVIKTIISDHLQNIDIDDEVKDKVKDITVIFSLMSLMVIGAGFAGAMMIKYWAQILGFGVLLGAFAVEMSFVYRLIGWIAGDKEIKANIEEFSKLIALSAATLLIGGGLLLLHDDLATSCFAFGILLGTFVLMIGAVIGVISHFGKESIEMAEDFSHLVAISAGSLLIGGALFAMFPELKNGVYEFGRYLLGFVMGIGLVVLLISRFGKRSIKMAEEFADLIKVCAGSLLIGGILFTVFKDIKQGVIDFAWTLGFFMVAIGGSIALATAFMKKNATGTMLAMSLLVAISGGMLILAGKFMTSNDIMGALGFVFVMSIFIVAMIGITILANEHLRKILLGSLAILALTVITGLLGSLMLFAGTIISSNPQILTNIMYFLGITLIYVSVMGLVAGLLGKFIKEVGLGIIAIFALIILTQIIVDEMVTLGLVATLFDGDKVLEVLLYAAGTIIGMAVLAGILGSLIAGLGEMSAGLSYLIAGTGLVVLWALIALTGEVVDVMGRLSNVANSFDGDKVLEVLKYAALTIGGMAVVVTAATAASVGVLLGKSALTSIIELINLTSNAMINVSKAGNAINQMKPINVEQVKKIINSMGEVVTTILDSDMCTLNPIKIGLIKSASTIAKDVSTTVASIGHGLKTMSELRIARYNPDGSIASYVTLTDEDFSKAAENVGKIVTVVLRELSTLATDPNTKELFEWHLTESPINRVIKSSKEIGGIISSVAEGVKNVGNIDVNAEKVATSVATIVSTIGKALGEVYNQSPEMFDWQLFGKSKYKKVIDMSKMMIELMAPVAKSVQDVANLKINDRLMNETDFTNASKHIAIILMCIGGAVKKVYEDNKELFDTRYLGAQSHHKKMIDTLNASMDIIFKSLTAIQEINKISDIEAGLKEGGKYQTVIKSIISLLPNAVQETYNNLATNDDFVENVESIKLMVSSYTSSLNSLLTTFNSAPEDTKKYDNIKNAIKNINVEISKTPDIKRFKEETQYLGHYVNKINQLNTQKVDKLTNLANALTKMSTQLKGIDKLTDALANRLSTVLEHLTDRLDKSAETIEKAEKIQNERHKKINDSIAEFKRLLDKPLNVKVEHSAKQENNNLSETPTGDSGNNPSTSGGYSPSTTPSVTPTTTTQTNTKPEKKETNATAQESKRHLTGNTNNESSTKQQNNYYIIENSNGQQNNAVTSGNKQNNWSERQLRGLIDEQFQENIQKWSATNDMNRGGGWNFSGTSKNYNPRS